MWPRYFGSGLGCVTTTKAASGAAFKLDSASAWMVEAATLLSPRAEDREALARLLETVFEYDAGVTLAARECQEVLAREGARQVIRALATEILKGGAVDSN